MAVTNKPRIEAYIGASGSGKGVSINQRLAALAPARLLIWDPRNEYGRHAPAVSKLGDAVRAFSQAGKSGPVKVRYVPGGAVKLGDAFGMLCRLAMTAGNLVLVAEELSDVTTASHAPPAWRQVTTQGRHAGLVVIGASQRPALIDKTFLANCTTVRVFQLGYDEDMRAMSKEVRAPMDALESLVTRDVDGGGADILCLEYERRTRTLQRGRITVSKSGKVAERWAPFEGVGREDSAPKARASKRAM